MLTRLPSGPLGSTIAGILLFGLISRKAGAICAPLLMLTGTTLYGSSISSSATDILRPFGVFHVCSSMVIFPPVIVWGMLLVPSLSYRVLRNRRFLQPARATGACARQTGRHAPCC